MGVAVHMWGRGSVLGFCPADWEESSNGWWVDNLHVSKGKINHPTPVLITVHLECSRVSWFSFFLLLPFPFSFLSCWALRFSEMEESRLRVQEELGRATGQVQFFCVDCGRWPPGRFEIPERTLSPSSRCIRAVSPTRFLVGWASSTPERATSPGVWCGDVQKDSPDLTGTSLSPAGQNSLENSFLLRWSAVLPPSLPRDRLWRV